METVGGQVAVGVGPDWGAIGGEVRCPCCDYNLRGLGEARCPECGEGFEWGALIEASTGRHPYLFEHQSGRSVWAFWRTLTRGLRPGRFWREVTPAHRVRVGRLVGYWVICCLIVVGLVPVVTLADRGVGVGMMAARMREQPKLMNLRAPHGTAAWQQEVDRRYPLPPGRAYFAMVWEWAAGTLGNPVYWRSNVLPELIWPWLSFGVLFAFRPVMRSRSVRAAPLLRCVIYSADVMVWYLGVWLAVAAVAWAAMLVVGPEGSGWTWYVRVIGYLPLLLWVVRTWRLGVACSRHLSVPYAVATVIGSQAIVFLLVAVAPWAVLEFMR